MGKKAEIEKTKRTALMIGGGALFLYLLVKSGFLEGALKGGAKEVYDRFVQSIKEMLPEGWTDLLDRFHLPDWPDFPVPDWWPDGDGDGNGVLPTNGDGVAGFASDLQTTLLRGGGIYARQIGGIAIRGRGLPGLWTPGGQVVSRLRLGERAVTAAGRITPRAISPLRSFLDDLAGRGISRFVGETAAKRAFPGVTLRGVSAAGKGVAWTTGVKAFTPTVLKTGARIIPKAALRAVPVVGWALAVSDVVADIARIFGADVTEWLGFSGIASPFLGYNPLERLFGGPLTRQAQAMGVLGVAPLTAFRLSEIAGGGIAPVYRPPSTIQEFGLQRIGMGGNGGIAPESPASYTPGAAKIYEHY